MRTWYVVSGIFRSGTSGMMESLAAGGLRPIWDKERDARLNEAFLGDPYQANERYYEITDPKDLPHFPREFEGRGNLFKIFYPSVGLLSSDQGYRYEIVMMKRNPVEIQESYEASFNIAMDTSDRHRKHGIGATANFASGGYERDITDCLAYLKTRPDCRVRVVDFRSWCVDPMPVYRALVCDGWPIDPVPAAATVVEEKCRFKVEELEAAGMV